MAGTRYEIDDLAGVVLEITHERGELASLLGNQSFNRLKILIIILHQALNDGLKREKLRSLYSLVDGFANDDSLSALAWICAKSRDLDGLAPLEALFDDDLSSELFRLFDESAGGIYM